MAKKIFERFSVNNDDVAKINYPPLNNETQYLITYEATTNLHRLDLKEIITEFLINQNAIDLESYSSSSIHFKLKGDNDSLDILSLALAKHIKLYEWKTGGKLFWVFNMIATLEDNTTDCAGMKGRGNKSLNDHYQEKVMLLRIKMRVLKRMRNKP